MSQERAPVEIYDPVLAEAQRVPDGDEEISLLARVTDPEALPSGVRVVSRLGDIVTLRATRDQLELLAACPAAVDLEAARRLAPPLTVVGASDPDAAGGGRWHSGYSRRPEGLLGQGCGMRVAILDWGFDFAGPAFRRPDGTTRFVALWDQRGQDGSGPGNRWGYGRILTRADIDRALATADPYAALGYDPADAATFDPNTGTYDGPAHGTHVLDIAAGSVRENGMSGVAPCSDLVAVHLAHTVDVVGTGNLGDSASIFDGLAWILSVVGDQPVVVNMCVGAQGGSHDGTSMLEQGIDQAVKVATQLVPVMSVGNYAGTGVHRHGRLGQGERTRLTITVPAAATRGEIEIWYSGVDRFTASVLGPDGALLGSASPGNVVPLRREGTDELGRMYHVRSARNGRHLIDILLSDDAPGGNWEIELSADSVPTGDGRFYSWIERQSGPHPHFVPADDDPRSTTGSLCNGGLSIAVGAYDPHRPGRPIASFSSGGPTVTGLIKPDVCAPGVDILAARSTPRGGTPGPAVASMSGTSMAAPHVTGLAALMLEAGGRATDAADIRAILLATADRPRLAGHHRDLHRVGAGYVDPVAAERAARPSAEPDESVDRPVDATSSDTPEERPTVTAEQPVSEDLRADELESEDVALEDVALEDVALEDVALEDVALEDVALEDVALEAPAEEAPPAPLRPAPKLPLVLAGPMVRRAQSDVVWFWIACSQEITDCIPDITVYNLDGSRNADLTGRMKLAPTTPQIVRLGEQLWVAMVAARPLNLTFGDDWIYGYDLAVEAGNATTSVRRALPDISYKPFDRPTFQLRSSTLRRVAHASCRRPGGYGSDACVVFDNWVAREVRGGATGNRPPALFLTGDQIYADDVAYPLFQAVRRLADDVFGHDEELPLPHGPGSISGTRLTVKDWRGKSDAEEWLASGRARLTRRTPKNPGARSAALFASGPQAGWPGEPSRVPAPPLIADRDIPGRMGFSTEDGEGHLLSFAEFAAMYLLVWNAELWSRYVREEPGSADPDTDNLTGFAPAVAAVRRLLANIPTYMLLDDHEITDDWNLDDEWTKAADNPLARRVISNGLAAYWAFQGWGNDPDQFDTHFVAVIRQHLSEMSASHGRPGAAAGAFDATLHDRYWAYAAPTRPPVLCVDTRTRREFQPDGKTVMSGPKTYPDLERLLKQGDFTRGEPLTIVLPTPFIGHRSMFRGQEHRFRWPRDRYEGDYEVYGNNAGQRPDFIWFLRSVMNPPALVVLSGDVHHGFVIDAMYAGAKTVDDIYRGRATWAMRVVQVTSSAIKNIKKDVFVDDKFVVTDAGKVGELVVPQYENQYKTMPGGMTIAQRAAAARLSGDLGRTTYVFENHFCLVDFASTAVDVLFIGDARDSKLAFEWHLRDRMPSVLWTARTRVGLANDPHSFTPPDTWLRSRYPLPVFAEGAASSM